MIDHQQNVYGWEFLFLGANQDAIATATRMSVPAANAHQWVADSEGLRGAVKLMCSSVSAMRSADGALTRPRKARPPSPKSGRG